MLDKFKVKRPSNASFEEKLAKYNKLAGEIWDQVQHNSGRAPVLKLCSAWQLTNSPVLLEVECLYPFPLCLLYRLHVEQSVCCWPAVQRL